MKDLIGVAVITFSLFVGTKALNSVIRTVQKEALTKAAQGLPRLSSFAAALQPHK